ncbi:MAG TPA: hypothetical protein VMV49_07995, partial [Candidatus Deferrimicrobium sp.]|nr:hypothetical protein [Candidatus Deferrimicrobium sp.]
KEMVFTFVPFFPPMMIAGLIGCFVIIGSKDHLWIYRKAPNGVKIYVKSVYFVNIIYPIIIMLPFSIIISIIVGLSLLEGFLVVILSIAFIFSLMAIGIGLAFIFPTFEERGGKVGILMGAFWGLGIGLWIGALFINIFLFDFFAPYSWFYGWSLPALIFCVVAGFLLLRLGVKKLSSME